MRVTQSEIYRNFLSDIETLNDSASRFGRQVTSGKKLNQLKDSPSGSAELVSLTKLASDIDQYRSNTDKGSLYLNVADSALNEVTNLISSIHSKGSQASADTVNNDARAALAYEVRSLREQMVTLANSQVNGRYLFAGSLVADAPFDLTADTVSYNGDSSVNTLQVEKGTEVPMNFSGDAVFGSIFNSVSSLLAGMDSNDATSIKSALEQFASVLTGLEQVRAQVGTNMGLLANVQTHLDTQETSLKEQRGKVEDADMAQAVVQMNQTQTALQTAMSAGGSILNQRNLFDILG
jgi:flagellar hook-associated protein 3 FlgL